MLENMHQLGELVRDGFTDWQAYGNVDVDRWDGLILFNYNRKAEQDGVWNWFETVSRGLVLEESTGRVVARPFDKFFNWGQGGRSTTAPIKAVYEKLDGSLGICFFWKGQWKIVTRGRLNSPQGEWATKWISQRAGKAEGDLGVKYTLLFEIIYPENRIVVNYGDREELVLLAIRNTETGGYVDRERVEVVGDMLGVPYVKRYHFYGNVSVPDLIAYCQRLDDQHEGFVAEFADGQRFKFKSDEYVIQHRFITSLSWKNMAKAMQAYVLDPSLFQHRPEFVSMAQRMVKRKNTILRNLELLWDAAPKGTRKEFAQYAMQTAKPYAFLLFILYDERILGKTVSISVFDALMSSDLMQDENNTAWDLPLPLEAKL